MGGLVGRADRWLAGRRSTVAHAGNAKQTLPGGGGRGGIVDQFTPAFWSDVLGQVAGSRQQGRMIPSTAPSRRPRDAQFAHLCLLLWGITGLAGIEVVVAHEFD